MLRKLKQPTILNSKGQPIVLNAKEAYHAEWMQRQVNERFGNSLGYEIPITTLTTIINRAKKLGCHRPRRKREAHDREVVTTAIGALVQHDASTHKWSPLASEKWTLITSIDDFSRKCSTTIRITH